jgi:hypothetical protein
LRLVSNCPIERNEIQEARERYQYEKKPWRFTVVQHDNWVELLEIGVADSSLLEVPEDFGKPRVIRDEILGGFVLDRRLNWFEGSWKFGGQKCILNVVPKSVDSDDLAWARGPLLELEDQVQQIEDAIANMLGLYNETWREEGEPLDREAFLLKTTISSITVHPNGPICLDFDGGELFLDHGIEVCIDGETITANLA